MYTKTLNTAAKLCKQTHKYTVTIVIEKWYEQFDIIFCWDQTLNVVGLWEWVAEWHFEHVLFGCVEPVGTGLLSDMLHML